MKIDRWITLAVLVACVSLPAGATPAWNATAAFEVQCEKGRLSVKADGVALGDILQDMSRRCQMEAHGTEGLDRPVRARFSALSMGEGIAKLMGNANFALVEVPAGPHRPSHLVLIVLDTSSRRMARLADHKSSPGAKPAKADKLSHDEETIRQVNKLHKSAKNGEEEALRRAAAEGDSTIQAVALQLLAKQDPERAADLAANSVGSTDPERRIASVQTLADIDTPKAADALGSVLKDTNTGVRESAVVALGSQTSPEVVGFLSQAANDQDPSIRSMAMDFLAQRGREGEDALRWLLYSDDVEVRSHVRELLAQMEE